MTNAIHRHDWARNTPATRPSTFACNECEATTRGCRDCDRPLISALLICDACLKSARKIITDIQEIIEQIPDAHADLMGLRPVKLGGGSPSADDPAKLPFGLDVLYDDPDRIGLAGVRTEQGCLDVLYGWANDWAEMRGHMPRPSLDYLIEYSLWAAQSHPAWDDYISDARAIRSKVRHLAGLNPEVQPAPCTDCGGRVVQDWTDKGLDDALVCTECATVWPNLARLYATNAHALLELGKHRLDLLVTIVDVKLLRPDIRPNTLDVWVRRGIAKPETAKFKPRGRTRDGQDVFLLADVVTAWNEREQAA